MKFYPNVEKGLRLVQKLGFKLIVVSNQSGLARGYFSTSDLQNVHRAFKKKLVAKGIRLSGIYFCPHLPTAGCSCRKPKPGLVRRAAREQNVDPKKSYVIG